MRNRRRTWRRPTRRSTARRSRDERVIARFGGDFESVPSDQVQYIDISPKQMVGVSAGLIPFLEHDDANRALMGSNMQRQAVPLLVTEPPIVATGLEKDVAHNTGMVIEAEKAGTVTYVDADRIKVDEREYVAAEVRRPQRAHLPEPEADHQARPEGQEGASASPTAPRPIKGELALGRNVLVAFMSWDGYNFEDAIIISEKLVKNDTYTSIHIEEFDIEIRETKLGKEEFTRDIPNVSPEGAVATSTRTASCASARSSSRATSWSARFRRSRRAN